MERFTDPTHPCFEPKPKPEMKKYLRQNHPYRWPKTIGFHTQNDVDQLVKHLEEDNLWYVTEKLDGCVLIISSEDWLASPSRIIGERGAGMVLEFYQGVSLKEDKIETLFKNTHTLKDKLKLAHFKDDELKLMLYGKVILKGTVSSRKDLYNYREKNIYPGDFICFGIGLVLPKNVQLPSEFSNAVLNNRREDLDEIAEQNCFAVPMNPYLCKLLACCAIDHNRICMSQKLNSILDDGKLIQDINKKKSGGYVLSAQAGEGLLKLIPIPNILCVHDHRERLEKVIELLKAVNHSTPKNAQIINKTTALISADGS
jgi:hypothetical protein